MAMVALFFTACNDDDPDTGELDGYFESHPYVSDPRSSSAQIVSISPESVAVNTVGERVVFTAGGGNPPYHWDVSNGSLGSISASGSAQGVYKAIVIGANDVIVYDQDGNAALARITGSAPGGSMTITPSSLTLSTTGTVSTLSVAGGTPPYSWTMRDDTMGIFIGDYTATLATSVGYQRSAVIGDNYVTVKDVSGDEDTLRIKQPLLVP
jgi:hypothetical protein